MGVAAFRTERRAIARTPDSYRRTFSGRPYLVTEKVEQSGPCTEPLIESPCGGGALRPIS